jgi:DtxR family Mn-dependent transcriptional regulator
VLPVGTRGTVRGIRSDVAERAQRLAVMGVTPGARLRVLQSFPGFVFECDQTELAVERAVAGAVLVEVDDPA